MRRLNWIFLVGTCATVGSVDAQQPGPNILWIVCEDISPFISSYGCPDVKTPNIDRLAKEGVRYRRVYTTAGVCAPSRSAIITGMHQTSIGTQHMRTAGDPKYQPVPSYSAVIPEYVKCFPEYLRKAGYYCTNNVKQDYQFEPPVTVWDENGPAASYRNRPAGTPFFSIFNFALTHESMVFIRKDSLREDPDKVIVPPFYPDTKTVRTDIARLMTNIEIMDQQVGELFADLQQDNVYDNTIIFFYSDHGGSLPWMKREILERGTHIPMIVRFPKAANKGTTNDELISAVDFAPTVLSLAGVKIPDYMQGQAFLGSQKAKTPRQYVFAARDRMDTEYDRVRMVRDKQFRYLFNYMPEKPYYQEIEFRKGIPMMREMIAMKNEGKLAAFPLSWFNPKPKEELYDVENDPDESKNLVNDAQYGKKADELRRALRQWKKEVGDQADVPENEMIRKMWGGQDTAPLTGQPQVLKTNDGVTISCPTKGASIGYRLVRAGARSKTEEHVIQCWDFPILNPAIKNGDRIPAKPAWKIYSGELISLQPGDTLKINAMRIGYKAAVVDYVNGKSIPR